MTTSGRKLVIGCAVLLSLSVILGSVAFVALGGLRLVKAVARASLRQERRPPDWDQAHVEIGEIGYHGDVVFGDVRLGTITELAPAAAPAGAWTVIGRGGAETWTPDGGATDFVAFATRASDVRMLGTGSERRYLDRGGLGWSKGALLGGDGRLLWEYGGTTGLDDLTAGHLDDPQRFDFVAGMNGLAGIRRLDANGAIVWQQQDANVWHVELVDADGDGLDEIVHSNARGLLTIRDRDGNVRSRHRLPCYLSTFRLVRWPAVDSPLHVVELDHERLWIVGLDGRVAASLPFAVPHLADLAVTVLPHAPGGPAIVAAATIERWNRSVLSVWDESGRQLHMEVLEGERRAVASDAAAGSGAFLVGGFEKLWRYTRAAPG